MLLVLSFNQPKFCPVVSWEANGTTVANDTMIGLSTIGMFIDTDNAIYVNDQETNSVQIWYERKTEPMIIKPENLNASKGIFVTNDGDIYLDNGELTGRVDKCSKSSNSSVPVMYVNGSCFGLFVDRDKNLYCSLRDQHRIVKRSLCCDSNTSTTTVAGNGANGSAPNMLNQPSGIFVDIKLNLYVADYGNNRIQLFEYGELSGRTLVDGSLLNGPTDIKVDADGNLFIVDQGNHRIVRFGSNGLYCIIGCSGANGAESDQFNLPFALAFDTYGDIFVLDGDNRRIQKFRLARNACVTYNRPKFCPNATWNVDGITVFDQSLIGNHARGIFVDSNDTLYAVAQDRSQILTLFKNSTNLLSPTNFLLANYTGIIVSIEGEIYLENGTESGRIVQWAKNTNTSVSVAYFPGNCFGLFIDQSNSLYCSMKEKNRVVKMSLNGKMSKIVNVAGTGTSGSGLEQFSGPWGIFVDNNFTLYVADSGNNRIQRFQLGENIGATIAGNGTPNDLMLNNPTDIILDLDGNLFIAGNDNSRIIRVIHDAYHCVVGCNRNSTSPSEKLNKSYAVRFDSRGNLFVADECNHRIQKFTLATNSCDSTTTEAPTTQVVTEALTIQVTTEAPTSQEITTAEAAETTTKASTTLATTIQSTTAAATTTTTTTTTASTSSTTSSNTSERDSTATSIICNTSNSSCDLLKPCQNDGTCRNTQTGNDCYVCLCSRGFNGTHCEFDHRPCKPYTCLNNGTCKETSDSLFVCTCLSGWQGVHCEFMVNFCDNFTCLNNGTCRSSLSNYTCCSPPSVRLAMAPNSLELPIKARRNDEFYISAYIELFCMNSIEAVSQWAITNCTTNCSSSISLNRPIITTLSEIHIPAKKLEYGIYEVKLTVSSVNIPIVTASAVGYIEIIPTGIMANLVSNGTSMITHDPQQYLTLDPGRFSEDPDEKEFNSIVSPCK
ncbi:unnamed protein product [Rotaria socialis]|uniref:EGF-like domain-containing protein n=1 Tax=Rotaria socialis TaxID=392032 RepID=A0A818V2P0_9BILA|nr:unnamed protein product [Rotaria socialis]